MPATIVVRVVVVSGAATATREIRNAITASESIRDTLEDEHEATVCAGSRSCASYPVLMFVLFA